ncbi:MAG: hypothetical protein LBI69_01850 [Puniceicoccales bacterium]|jgi:hypothetical protein|nr:hypothetical protein [Puniceicoccales bacterium]
MMKSDRVKGVGVEVVKLTGSERCPSRDSDANAVTSKSYCISFKSNSEDMFFIVRGERKKECNLKMNNRQISCGKIAKMYIEERFKSENGAMSFFNIKKALRNIYPASEYQKFVKTLTREDITNINFYYKNTDNKIEKYRLGDSALFDILKEIADGKCGAKQDSIGFFLKGTISNSDGRKKEDPSNGYVIYCPHDTNMSNAINCAIGNLSKDECNVYRFTNDGIANKKINEKKENGKDWAIAHIRKETVAIIITSITGGLSIVSVTLGSMLATIIIIGCCILIIAITFIINSMIDRHNANKDLAT